MTLNGAARRARAIREAILRRRRRSLAAKRLGESVPPMAQLHLGCGAIRLEGWVNIDIDRGAHPDIRVDLRGGLPATRRSITYIFSEHVFEHLTLNDGVRLLADCQCSLVKGGVMRIAMPDLEQLVDRYQRDWRDQTWLDDPAYREIDSPANMLNFAMRSWGHLYLYDFAELERRLREAGFEKLRRCEWQRSEHDALRGLEQRPDSLLIVEATA